MILFLMLKSCLFKGSKKRPHLGFFSGTGRAGSSLQQLHCFVPSADERHPTDAGEHAGEKLVSTGVVYGVYGEKFGALKECSQRSDKSHFTRSKGSLAALKTYLCIYIYTYTCTHDPVLKGWVPSNRFWVIGCMFSPIFSVK